ncbi:hypothetical protein ACFL6S_13065 [Candidatus Poribacteria bacterium]
MFDVVNSYKSEYMFFAGVTLDGDHTVYLSAYGRLASALLEKYVEDQRADNEEDFAKWDKTVKKAASKVGFSANHDIEDGHVYISSFQNGIGVAEEDETGLNKGKATG